MFNHILFSEYCNFLFKPDGTVWNYDNMVLKQFPLPEPVTPGAAGHPYGYAIGKSGALYMLWGDSQKFLKIADNVKLVAAYWEWAVVVYRDNAVDIMQHGRHYSTPQFVIKSIQQVAAAHYVLFRDAEGLVHQYDWSRAAWRSGTVWQKSVTDMEKLLPRRVPLPGPATDITTTRTQHSTAIVNGEPYTWCDLGGAKYVGLKAATSTPTRMTDIWSLKERIKQVRSSDNTTHVITASGQLWGGGVNDLGEVGNGQKEANVLATGKWPMSTKLIVMPFVEVGRPGEVYTDIFWGSSYGHRKGAITDRGIIRMCGRNKYGLCCNGIYPEQPSDPAKLVEGMWSVATFRRAIFPERLTLKTADEGWAMTKAGTYPPKEPRSLVKTIITRFYDDGTEEAEEVKA